MRVRTQRVPAGYRELEYIESTGTQYINTGISIGDDFEFILDQLNNFDIGNHYMVGSSVSGKMLGTLNDRLWSNGLTYSSTTFNRNIREKIGLKVHITNSSGADFVMTNYTTNNKQSSHSNYTPVGSSSVYLFRVGGYYESFKCYNFKLYHNNELVRNFIPCIRTSDNKPGLYDTVNSIFYTNQGTGEFIKGSYKDSYKLSLLRLPSTYQEVEYIESTDGNQLIKIGSSDATKYYVKQSFNQLGTGRYTLQGYSSTWYGTADNSSYFQYADGKTVTTSTQLSTNTIYEITLDSNGIKLNDTFFAYDQSRSKTWTKFGLFQIEDYPQFKFKGKVYNSKVFNADNKVIKNLIPCYRKSDNVIGMYDIVEGKFYTNKGSGTFTKGNDVKNIGMFTPKILLVEGTTNLLSSVYDSLNYCPSVYNSTYTILDETFNGYPIIHCVGTSTSNSGFRYTANVGLDAGKSLTYSIYLRFNGSKTNFSVYFAGNAGGSYRDPIIHRTLYQQGTGSNTWAKETVTIYDVHKNVVSWSEVTVDTWYYIVVTVTNITSDESTIWVSNHYFLGGSNSRTWDVVCPQIELKDHATPFTTFTRFNNTVI